MNDNTLYFGFGFGAGLVVGSVSATYIALRYAQTQYLKTIDEHIADQLAEERDALHKAHKVGDYSTPESTLTKLHPEETSPELLAASPLVEEDMTELKEKIAYNNYAAFAEIPNDADDISEEPEVISAHEELLARELEKRDNGDPYLISLSEWNDNDHLEKFHMDYFEDDDVLTDGSSSVPVSNADDVIGVEHLEMFGIESGDKDTVYIRNDAMSILVKVVREGGSYESTVTKELKHSDSVKKFRGGYE